MTDPRLTGHAPYLAMEPSREAVAVLASDVVRILTENASDLTFDWDLRTGHLEVFGAEPDRLGDGERTPNIRRRAGSRPGR